MISGKAEPNSKVVIDGKEYPVNAAGDFSADLAKKLSNGETVEVKAKDASDNLLMQRLPRYQTPLHRQRQQA